MNTLTRMALGLMGQFKARPARGTASQSRALPPPGKEGGVPLMQALWQRQSRRGFGVQPLPDRRWASCCGPPPA
jgi:hypothetical protein